MFLFFQFVIYIATEEEEGLYNLYFHSCPNYGYPKSPVYLDFTVSLRTILLIYLVNHKYLALYVVAFLFPHRQSCQVPRLLWVATPWVVHYSATIWQPATTSSEFFFDSNHVFSRFACLTELKKGQLWKQPIITHIVEQFVHKCQHCNTATHSGWHASWLG